MVKNSQEKKDIIKNIKKLYKPSISMHIIATIVLIGPVLNLIIKLGSDKYYNYSLNCWVSVVALILISINWLVYHKKCKSYKAKCYIELKKYNGDK